MNGNSKLGGELGGSASDTTQIHPRAKVKIDRNRSIDVRLKGCRSDRRVE
jgi:hypothetical protein